MPSITLFTRAVEATDMSPKYTKSVVEAAFIDIGANNISSIGRSLLSAVKVANMRDVKPNMNHNKRRLNGIKNQ